jgi:hypothetical protein
MTSRVIAVAVDCHDPYRLAAFWARALGRARPRPWRDPRGTEYVQLDPVDGDPCTVLFQPVPEPRAGKNRLHLDIAPPAGLDQADEVARLVGLGATVLAVEGDLPWVTLADPEGNEFCVLPSRAPRPEPVAREV